MLRVSCEQPCSAITEEALIADQACLKCTAKQKGPHQCYNNNNKKIIFSHLSPLPSLDVFVPGKDLLRVTVKELMAQNTIIFPHIWQMHQETTAKNSGRGVCRTARGQPFLYNPHLTFWWRKAPFRGFLIHPSGVAGSLLSLHPASNVAQQGEHLGTMVRGMQGCNGSWKAERAARAGGNAVTATARCNPSHYLEPGE